MPEVHEPPDRPEDESPSKKARTDEPGEAADGVGVPVEVDDDELMIEDVHFVEKSGQPQQCQFPEGWAVVNNLLEIDEVWLANAVKGIRKGEINTRRTYPATTRRSYRSKDQGAEVFLHQPGVGICR